ncbi:MAG: rhodanese-like domain-containing protein [candidate division NC10 bacterium]|nr:rhodanese-like domain-containing protein [candidate division NC10 bacterium]
MTELGVRRVSAQDVKRRLDAGEVLVFDVRKKEVFDRGHLKGARPLPIKERATWAQEIPRGKSIVFY